MKAWFWTAFYHRHKFAGRAPENPAVLFLDVKMPKVSGVEVLRVMKSDDALRTMPVVRLTSSREETDETRSYQFGANAYVVKPMEFAQTVRYLGLFSTAINEPPPARLRTPATLTSAPAGRTLLRKPS